MALIYLLISVLVVSLISFVGALTLAIRRRNLEKVLLFLVAFSAGALIGDAFLHLLPEALAQSNSLFLSSAIFSGIIFFFLLEKILRWRHCHDVDCVEHPKHLGLINLVGDGIHNLMDGLLIGASFAVSIPLGIATTTAVLIHEIPQELADFGVLLHSGYTVRKALLLNFLTAAISIIGAVFAYTIGQDMRIFSSFMLPFTIGGFIYIALTDLIPELHKDNSFKQTISHFIGLFLGIGVMFLLLLIG